MQKNDVCHGLKKDLLALLDDFVIFSPWQYELLTVLDCLTSLERARMQTAAAIVIILVAVLLCSIFVNYGIFRSFLEGFKNLQNAIKNLEQQAASISEARATLHIEDKCLNSEKY